MRIDQHQIGAGGLDAADAVLHHLGGLGGIETAQHRVGADLPDHQVRLHVDHRGLQPLHHFGRILAALAAIEHGDVGGRILAAQLRGQPVGIGEFRRVEPKPSVDDEPNAMITTGLPAASLAATCGSDPIDLTPPFGGRQGTRLKMSLALSRLP